MLKKRNKLIWALALAFASGALIAGCSAGGSDAAYANNEGSTAATGGDVSAPADNGDAAASAGGGDAAAPAENSDTGNADSGAAQDTEKPVVEITMENGGVITIALDPEAEPITVANFLKLVDEGFYDGLTFHRIIPGFMIQGGDPKGTGTGGSDATIKGEFSANGWDDPISHVRGVISMARSQSFNSASSQFFITNADSTFLDGQYAAFGTVTSGMDVVDEISAVKTDGNDRPLDPVVMKTVRRAS